MPEEPSKILCDADFSVCYDGAHMRFLFGGSSNDSTRKLKSGIQNGEKSCKNDEKQPENHRKPVRTPQNVLK